MYSKILVAIIVFILFALAKASVSLGSFITLPYKNLSLIKAILITLPFQWINYVFVTFAVNANRLYNILTPIQLIYLQIILLFVSTIIINYFYLKKKVYFSDYIASILLFCGFIISISKLATKVKTLVLGFS